MQKLLIIWEMANNHDGDINKGIHIIDSLKRVKESFPMFDYAIKLQLRNIESFIHPAYRTRFDVPHIQRFVETKLSDIDFEVLCSYIKDAGFQLGITPFDEDSVDRLNNYNIDFVKIASCCANEWSLIDRSINRGKPIIVSTGGLNWDEIDNIYNFLKHKEVIFSLLHCVGVYPAEDINLNVIDKMKRRYDVPIGYSGHETKNNIYPCVMAIAKGAMILERHIGSDEGGSLNNYSLDIKEADSFVKNISTALCLNGSDKKDRLELEKENLRKLKRGVWTINKIEKGDFITKENSFFAIPSYPGQLLSEDIGVYRKGICASRDYEGDEPITNSEECRFDKIATIRNYIHIAKGMLAEAGIKIGSTYQAELSHHYGLENFRHWGLISIGIINREYCSKIIIMLPDQEHPSHKHIHKEETFRVLWGDLLIKLGDKNWKSLKAGETILVERNRLHEFKTKEGVVFEEISTTHINGDSFYEDKRVYDLDPMEKKTSIEKL